jgi:hypothetical protein
VGGGLGGDAGVADSVDSVHANLAATRGDQDSDGTEGHIRTVQHGYLLWEVKLRLT